MSLSLRKPYRLHKQVVASEVDDNLRARFPMDTELPQGTQFLVIDYERPWPNPDSPPFYFIELRSPGTGWKLGSRYAVSAHDLEHSLEKS